MLGLSHSQKKDIGLDFVLANLQLQSPYGHMALKGIMPYTPKNKKQLENCFDNIQKLMEANLGDMPMMLAHFKNISGILEKLKNHENLDEVELFEIKAFLLNFEKFLPAFDKLNDKLSLANIHFVPLIAPLNTLDPLKARIAPFSIGGEFSQALIDIRQRKLASCQKTRPAIVEEETKEELRVMMELSDKIRKHLRAFDNNIKSLGQLDLTMAKATLAKSGGTRPIITKDTIKLKGMTNPMVAAALSESGSLLVPVDISLATGTTIITGANMGGKSVAIKTVSLNVALCLLGFFPFADYAEVALVDGIFLIMEDMQNLKQGLSSFGGEISRLNTLLDAIGSQFLLIALDEFAKTTNPKEGAAIVRATAAHLAAQKCISLLSTHYDQVPKKGMSHYQVKGMTNTDGRMDYSLQKVEYNSPIPKNALNICEALGLNPALLDKIKQELI